MTVRIKRGRAARFLGVSVLALCAAAQIGVARGQESAQQLEEINVQGQGKETAEGPVDGYVASRTATGSKTDTPLVETPQSISIVTRDEIEDRGATTLQEALAYTPGVSSFSSGRSLYLDEFDIRGFSSENGNLGQLRDGMKLQANVYDGSQEVYGLERIEILKGPASILYGQLAPGGVINSISKRPTFTPQGEINLTGGSFDTKQFSGDVSGPIGGEGSDWAFRLTALARDANTWIDHVPDDKRYIAPALTWKPTDDTSLTVLGYYQEIRTRFVAPMDAFGTVFGNRNPGGRRVPRDLFIGDTSFDRYNIDSGAIAYIFDHKFNENISFSSRGRYFEAKSDWNYLTSLGFVGEDNGAALACLPTGSPNQLCRGRSERKEHSKVWTADNHFQFNFDTGPVEHTAVVGVDYARQTYDTVRQRDSAGGWIDIGTGDKLDPTGDVGGAPRGFDRTITQVGVYAQDQIKILDKFIFLGGLRKDWATTDFTYENPAWAMFNGKQKDDDLTGRLGFVYLAPNGFAPYVSYSESFAPSVAAERTILTTLKPTTGKQYEGGVRWTSPDGKTLITGSVYHIEQKNLPFGTLDTPTQVGLVRSKGFELEAKTEIGPWQLSAGYAYTDAKTIKDDSVYVDPTTGDEIHYLVGQRLPTIPLHQASLWAIYDFTSMGVRGLKLGAGVKYVGKTNIPPATYFDGAFEEKLQKFPSIPSYVTFDAVAKMDFGAISSSMQGFYGQVNATNLFNKKTYSCALGFQGCDYGAPRTVLATVSYKW
ncbi:MAG: TonB-dependent siderophore receptor [Ancylobacter novellus]|uniref:TonB-dependent siderophore receptor n=1 Tax=Ancylobacter novellus TaxID=921 RepID=A0A2W5K7S4_ANCNO|nr:MAG: TonB-dependent siderophore receptor [Ancylobacter novellus]